MSTAYGAVVLEHFRRPRNQRRIESPTVSREGWNPLCGDRVRIELHVEEGVIRDAAFTANACAICTAAASLLTEQVKGAGTADVAALAAEQVIGAMGEVPAGRRECAMLPVRTLREALGVSPASTA